MDETSCSIVLILTLIVVVVLIAVSTQGATKKLKEARQAYRDSLQKLGEHPTHRALRQRTLELGRAYSNLTRGKKGVTLFDEVALMNDINAACGSAMTVVNARQRQPGSSSGEPSTEQRLARLRELHAKGVIDDEEYRGQRSRILGSL